jgi:creatinine amidohydrolase
MKLATTTWPQAAKFAEEGHDKVCLIPVGSLEQHGPHLPLFTDSLIVTAAAEEIERRMEDRILLLPTLWLGASSHHMAFAGSLTASFEGYLATLEAVLRSLAHHGFSKFFVLNGHGGNTDLNALATRRWRQEHPGHQLGHGGYFDFADPDVWQKMKGERKTIRHACEAETSLMLFLHPSLVKMELAVDDGLQPEVPLPGAPWTFDELTEMGVLGQATLGDPVLGEAIFRSCIEGAVSTLSAFSEGIVLSGTDRRPTA